jgi:hypothetical protein
MAGSAEDPKSSADYVPSGALLNRWSESAWDNGLQVDHLRDLQSLKIHTQNSVYEIIVISAGNCHVLLRGGKYFPEWVPVGFSGSTFGGSFIKMRGIYVGFCMEFNLGEMRIFTTSPVQWIGPVEDPGEIPMPDIRTILPPEE